MTMWSLSYILEIEQMWVAMILDLASPLFIYLNTISINYEIKSVKIINRNRMDAAPCFILAINNSPMDTKTTEVNLNGFRSIFLWKQTTTTTNNKNNNWEKESLSLWMNATPIKIYLCLIIMYHNEFVIYACCLSDYANDN